MSEEIDGAMQVLAFPFKIDMVNTGIPFFHTPYGEDHLPIFFSEEKLQELEKTYRLAYEVELGADKAINEKYKKGTSSLSALVTKVNSLQTEKEKIDYYNQHSENKVRDTTELTQIISNIRQDLKIYQMSSLLASQKYDQWTYAAKSNEKNSKTKPKDESGGVETKKKRPLKNLNFEVAPILLPSEGTSQ